MNKKSEIVTRAEAAMLDGIDRHRKFAQAIVDAKQHAFWSGAYFDAAKREAFHGEWLQLCEKYAQQCPDRTIRRYTKFYADCISWARNKYPKLADEAKLQKIACRLIMESALSFTELCREIGQIEERSANGARDWKAAPKQLDLPFNFDVLDMSLMSVELHREEVISNLASKSREELEAARDRLLLAIQLFDQAIGNEERKDQQ